MNIPKYEIPNSVIIHLITYSPIQLILSNFASVNYLLLLYKTDLSKTLLSQNDVTFTSDKRLTYLRHLSFK